MLPLTVCRQGVFGDAQKMGEKSEKIRRCLDIKKTYITHKTRGGWLRPLSKDTKNKDSGAPCIVIVDEYHAHQSSDIVEILNQASASVTSRCW